MNRTDLHLTSTILNTLVLSLLVTIVLACNQPFDPRTPLQDQVVIFSILSTDRNNQFVRVEHNYMPTVSDPLTYTLDNQVKDALVSISEGIKAYTLVDTIFGRVDTSRFKFPLHAYVLNSFTPQSGKTYQIKVQSAQLGAGSATVVVPGKPSLAEDAGSSPIIDQPTIYSSDADIIFSVFASTTTRGYIGRLFIDYDVLKGNEWVGERAEVPISFLAKDIKDLHLANYPKLMPRSFTNRVAATFNNAAYQAVVNSLTYGRYKSNKLIFKWTVYQFLQVEQNLYNYYQITHAYRDAQSMRLDEPLYSNIDGGVGMVGAYSLDSLVHVLPKNFYGNIR
jgi:hypothetical protein